jgi:hypothetical protein
MKTSCWILYPQLLVLLFSSNHAIAGEQERLRADIPLATFLLNQTVTPSARATTPVTPFISPSPAQIQVPSSLPNTVNSQYLIAPRAVKLKDVNPSTTQIPINGTKTLHQSQSELTTGIESGNHRNSTVSINGIKLFSPYVAESISRQRVYRIEYTNSYNQVQTVRQQRDIVTTVVEPQTVLGMRQQISLIGDCLDFTSGGSDSSSSTGVKQLCAYIPGILTDNTSIDPDKLVPTKINQLAQFGEVISPESLAAILQPGFQTGANGQKVGIDLYFPRVGTTDGNLTNSIARVERREEQLNVPTVTTGRIQQVLVSNGTQSGIARTVRGFTFVLSDRNTAFNSGLQLLGTVLADAEPRIPPGKSGRAAKINPNLVLAANNARLPENSFTAYSAGWGYANNTSDSQAGTPAPAYYNTMWIGLSPMIDRQVFTTSSYRTTGSQRIKVASGGEGGAQSSVSSSISINDRNFSSPNIGNAYSQVYLTLFEQDADQLSTTRLRESTTYYPHISLSGNTTTANSVLRYYSGAIIDPGLVPRNGRNQFKAYAGIDFTQTTPGGFSYDLAAVSYFNPDPEYYSRITANTSQKIGLGRNRAYNLVLNAGLNYAIDGDTEFDRLRFRSGNSSINTGATLNLGDVSLGTTYFIPNGLPNSVDSLLSTNINWRIKDNIAISGYYTPINKNSPKSTYGLSAAFKVGKEYHSPSLVLNWSQNTTSFGQSATGNQLSTNENVFGLFFRFGEPINPGKLN